MSDFIDRFGQVDAGGNTFLSSSRQSIITSVLCAGSVHEYSTLVQLIMILYCCRTFMWLESAFSIFFSYNITVVLWARHSRLTGLAVVALSSSGP